MKRDTNCPRMKPTMKAITNPNTEMPDRVDGFTRVSTCFYASIATLSLTEADRSKSCSSFTAASEPPATLSFFSSSSFSSCCFFTRS